MFRTLLNAGALAGEFLRVLAGEYLFKRKSPFSFSQHPAVALIALRGDHRIKDVSRSRCHATRIAHSENDMSREVRWVWVMIGLLALAPALARAGLPEAPPASLGFDGDRLERIDASIEQAIASGQIPGAVVVVGRRGKIALVRAVGRRAIEPASEPMTRDTIFDMASLTKPIATATSVMILIDEGKLGVGDRISRLLPEFANHGKGPITVEQLLRHRAGFVPDNPLNDYQQGADQAWRRIAEFDLMSPPGEQFRYSDVGFLVLGRLVERRSGQRLDVFAHEKIFKPLGMADAHFRPIDAQGHTTSRIPADRIAPTERDKPGGQMLRGAVHDPRSRALGGVAGHAGLFATADALAIYAQMLLNGGVGPNGRRILSPLAVRRMIDSAATPPGQRRGLGWDIETSFSAPRGSLFGPTSFGHTGFTGTSLWIDPETESFVVILTSRLHPDGKKAAPTALRAEVATLVAAAITDAPFRPETPLRAGRTDGRPAIAARVHHVQCGIDVLAAENFARLRNLKVGLVTNHTGRTRDGRSTIDVLFRAPAVKLVRLFSPEHGIRGEVDAAVANSKDEATGLPIISLYGQTRKPLPRDLEGLDALVYDIQDIGTRFYTYISTLGLLLEAASESGKKVFVLDRPNPIGGVAVSGPLRDEAQASFVAYHALPVRHGMTVGELALLYNAERKIGAKLEVVRCNGWHRADLYDRTGLLWINPSPNMRSLTEAILYPGVGLLETTNLATGRGTDTPFERVGAPWIDPVRFATALDDVAVPGVRFVPISFTPKERQHAQVRCGGVLIVVVNWDAFDPLVLGITLAVKLRALYPQAWQHKGLLRLLANRASYDDIVSFKSVNEITARWRGELEAFRQVRSRYLLY
jgi:uncharacterized protein YbbC (DUF1343 family)/CubicO group peptidase (beta-lactamase class C family)